MRRGFVLSFLFFLLLLAPSGSHAEDDQFPVFDSIRPNIRFWEDVYSKYSLSQGIIHDKDNLAVIYEIIDLAPAIGSGGRKANRQRVNEIKDKYRSILSKLAAGADPANDEEQRVRDLFGPDASPSDFNAAADNIRLQVGQKDRFVQGVVRSGAYLPEVQKIFKSYGLSEDLAYLAHVESSYNYKAYSKFGAAGIWQFTRSTGRLFMTVDYTMDERRDPIRATHAAAQLLKRNYERLGSWPLAITAYNHGAEGMERAKELLGDYETVFNKYNGRAFKFASRNFYSEFLAARNVAKNYQDHFGELELDDPVQSCEVRLTDYASIHDLADHFQVSVSQLRELNPALREPVFLGQKHVPRGCTLRLPAKVLAQNDTASLAIPDALYKDEQKHSQFYRVSRGDTLGKIARVHHISMGDLVAANQLDSRATIYAGQNLRIPSSGEKIVVLTADNKKIAVKPEVVQVASIEQQEDAAEELEALETPSVSEPEIETEPPQTEIAQASVVPFASSADKLLTDVASNWPGNVDTTDVSVKQQTNDSLASEVNPAVISGNFQVTRVYEDEGRNYGVITVEAEETLGHYAEWLEVSAQELRRLNGFRFGRSIRISQSIKIPLEKVSRAQFEERRYEYHKEMEEDFWAAYRVEGVRDYRIRKGENIWTLCNSQFELPFWLVKKYNEAVQFDKLRPSQVLVVPVVGKIS